MRQVSHRGYSAAELPCAGTLRNKLNDLGYRLRKVKTCLPLKKIPETDAIFEAVHRINQSADQDVGVLRISLDSKSPETPLPGVFLERNRKMRFSDSFIFKDLLPLKMLARPYARLVSVLSGR